MRTILILFVLGWGIAAAEPGTVIVLNKGAASATLIDRASGKTVATLKTGDGPHEVAVSPDGTTAVVTNYGAQRPGNTLTVFDLANKKVKKTIDLGKYQRPHGVMFFPDGKRLAVTTEAQKVLSIVDLEAGKVLATIDTAQNVSHMVALSPKADRAYVANIGSGSLTVLDVVENKRLANIATGRGAEGVDVSPDGRQIWVSNREAGMVSVVDAEKLQIVDELPCKGYPIRVKFTPDGKHALVSCAYAGDLAVFDAKTRKEVARISLRQKEMDEKGTMFRRRGPVPIGIVIPPDGKVAYVANGNYDQVAAIDCKTWKVVARYQTGRQPDGMAFSRLVLGQ